MHMIGCFKDDAVLLLPAHKAVLHPRIGENLLHIGALTRVELQHSADDVAGFSREQPKQSQGAFDGGLCVGVGLGGLPAHGLVLVVVMVVVVFVFWSAIVGAARVPRCWLGLNAFPSIVY